MPHVTFIHGIANKPAADKLLQLWKDALAEDSLGNDDGIGLGSAGVSTSMIYWADVLYEKPLYLSEAEGSAGLESLEAVAEMQTEDPDMSWRDDIHGEEKRIIEALATKLSVDQLVAEPLAAAEAGFEEKFERIPLPWPVKKRIMKHLLKDVHHYLFNQHFSPRPGIHYHVQDEIRSRVINTLTQDSQKNGPHIVVSHSMGTVIMYDCLKRVADCPAIDGLMTIGSPLGIDEIQDCFKPEWTRENGFPEKLKGRWYNIYDTFDPVTGFDGNISNDFMQAGDEVIEVINEQNRGVWRHNITNYFSGPQLRSALRNLLQL